MSTSGVQPPAGDSGVRGSVRGNGVAGAGRDPGRRVRSPWAEELPPRGTDGECDDNVLGEAVRLEGMRRAAAAGAAAAASRIIARRPVRLARLAGNRCRGLLRYLTLFHLLLRLFRQNTLGYQLSSPLRLGILLRYLVGLRPLSSCQRLSLLNLYLT